MLKLEELHLFFFVLPAFGCPSIDEVKNAQMTRISNELFIQCLDGSESWTLNCVDKEWQGTFGGCTSSGN